MEEPKFKVHAKLKLSDDRRKNKLGFTKFCKKLRGCYILCDENMEYLYVGQSSTSIEDRLLNHMGYKRGAETNKYVKRIRRNIAYIILIKENNAEKRGELEYQLINYHKPFCNIKMSKDVIERK